MHIRRETVISIFTKEMEKLIECEDPYLPEDIPSTILGLEKGLFIGATNEFKDIFNIPREQVIKEKYYWAEDLFLTYYSKYFRKVYHNYFKNNRSYLVRLKSLPNYEEADRYSLEDIGQLTHKELDPELYEIRMNNAKSYERDREPERISETKQKILAETTGLFKCGRCRSERTTYYERQQKSSDEPMTAFITCLDCKNRWKR